MNNNKQSILSGNLAIELQTIEKMTEIYCLGHHGQPLCNSCEDFIAHAQKKLDRCVYGQDKPACKHCPIHCYKPNYRQQAQTIMRYAGPRMMFKHPILTIRHLIKDRKQFPKHIPNGLSNYQQRKHK